MTDGMTFTQAIAWNLEGVAAFSPGALTSCHDCGLGPYATGADISAADEGHFSPRPCDSCGTSMAGTRMPAHGMIDGEICHFEICHDCALYHANGEIPEGAS